MATGPGTTSNFRRRLFVLAACYLGLVGVLLVHLWLTMVQQNKKWLTRSYVHRWAFRDVPTRRGAIRDRQGVVLTRDEPTSTLEVHYYAFRRRHPCGVVVHFANMLRAVAGEVGRFTYRRPEVAAAFRRCLDAPMSYLRSSHTDRRTATDLRFYASRLFAALSDGASSRFRARIAKELAAGVTGTVCECLGLDPVALAEVFQQRLDELDQLDGRVRRSGGRDVWQQLRLLHRRRGVWLEAAALDREARARFLVQRREAGQVLPHNEQVPWTVHRRLPYAAARHIATRREWHPGLSVRPSVVREPRSSGGLRWESIRPVLGRVTRQWAGGSDKDDRKAAIDGMMPEFEWMAQANAGLTEELRDRVTHRLKDTMGAYLRARGRIGRHGVEAECNRILRGSAGVHWLQRGRAREVGLWSSFDVSPGDDVHLTVDLRLQDKLERAVDAAMVGFEGKVAAMAVIDATTGDVLALVSRPLPVPGSESTRSLPEPAVVWRGNGAIGSVAKSMILLEHLDAMRQGRAHLHQREFQPCSGPTAVKSTHFGVQLRCDHRHGETVNDCVVSLGESCNAFFYQAGLGLGEEGVARAYRRFGLIGPPAAGADLPPAFQAHIPGFSFVADPTFNRRRKLHKRAIGYGIQANVLQIARAYAGLATGRLPWLSLVRRRPSDLRFVDLGVHDADLEIVRRGLKFCVERGTADDVALDRSVWAKTGTAEVTRLGHNNAWFAGYVEGARGPRLAFASVIYMVAPGTYGASTAGPMIRKFLELVRADPALEREFL